MTGVCSMPLGKPCVVCRGLGKDHLQRDGKIISGSSAMAFGVAAQ